MTRRQTRRQLALWPITTRSVPAHLLFDGDAALRSPEVRRARGALRQMEFEARNIAGWPHWPEPRALEDLEESAHG